MKAEMKARFVANTIAMTAWRHGKPDALLHHPDQESNKPFHAKPFTH